MLSTKLALRLARRLQRASEASRPVRSGHDNSWQRIVSRFELASRVQERHAFIAARYFPNALRNLTADLKLFCFSRKWNSLAGCTLSRREIPMSKSRVYSPAERVVILKRYLVEKVPISDLCDECGIHVNQFHAWLKIFFENGAAAFATSRPTKAVDSAKDKKIEQLEAKLVRKNEVMAELLEAHTELKKSLGES
jgi:transposase-like protein